VTTTRGNKLPFMQVGILIVQIMYRKKECNKPLRSIKARRKQSNHPLPFPIFLQLSSSIKCFPNKENDSDPNPAIVHRRS